MKSGPAFAHKPKALKQDTPNLCRSETTEPHRPQKLSFEPPTVDSDLETQDFPKPDACQRRLSREPRTPRSLTWTKQAARSLRPTGPLFFCLGIMRVCVCVCVCVCVDVPVRS